jgi:hypothetical protein
MKPAGASLYVYVLFSTKQASNIKCRWSDRQQIWDRAVRSSLTWSLRQCPWGRGGSRCATDPNTGAHSGNMLDSGHATFMKQLYAQKRVNLQKFIQRLTVLTLYVCILMISCIPGWLLRMCELARQVICDWGHQDPCQKSANPTFKKFWHRFFNNIIFLWFYKYMWHICNNLIKSWSNLSQICRKVEQLWNVLL